MGFAGKPSKGCAPCRAKRTKCDLTLPSCTQCIRKNRLCSGYRNEQDMLFRNETTRVVRRENRRADERSQSSYSLSPDRGMLQFLDVQQPSRIAAIDDEAVEYFFAHYNEKFFSSDGRHGDGGFDYILPVFQSDLNTGGPVPDIVRASGLAALGSMKSAPELLTQARTKEGKVLRQLTKQLQNPAKRLSDSSILTCILLSILQNIICDTPASTKDLTAHLTGACELVKRRGPEQCSNDVGLGIYARMRGFILAHCLQTRDPLPSSVVDFLDDEDITERDFEPYFYRLLARLCQIRADQKTRGYVDDGMARDAQTLMYRFATWQPSIPSWDPQQRPSADFGSAYSVDPTTYRYIWLASIWIFQLTVRILASDLVIEWARTQLLTTAGSPASATLDDAVSTQLRLCEELKLSTDYYILSFKQSQSTMKMIGGYGLLWPLYVLSTSSTSTLGTLMWIEQRAENIAEDFGVRQGKAMAGFMRMYTQSSPTLTSSSGSSF